MATTTHETRPLGKNGPELTTIGFGAWAAGGPWLVGWGPQKDEDSIAAIVRSVELGVNWIDTAAIYGLGHSEVVVGQALKQIDRSSVILATKCGRVPREQGMPYSDLSPAGIERELTDSLRRLQVETIDLYQFHWPDNDSGTPVEESWQTLIRAKEAGKIRWLGVSNFDVPLLERCEALHHVDSLQPPYSLLRRESEAVLPWCLEHGTGVIVYSPMQAGLLSGKFDVTRLAEDDWRRRNPYFLEPQLTKNLAIVERLRPIAERHSKTVGQLAIAWTLMNPAVTSAIVGARNPAQVDDNVGAMNWRLTEAEMAEIEAACTAE